MCRLARQDVIAILAAMCCAKRKVRRIVSREIRTVRKLEAKKVTTTGGTTAFKRLETKATNSRVAPDRARSKHEDKTNARRKRKKVLSIHDAEMMVKQLQHSHRKRERSSRTNTGGTEMRNVQNTMQKAMASAHSTGAIRDKHA